MIAFIESILVLSLTFPDDCYTVLIVSGGIQSPTIGWPFLSSALFSDHLPLA
jgi:hypothetical protein